MEMPALDMALLLPLLLVPFTISIWWWWWWWWGWFVSARCSHGYMIFNCSNCGWCSSKFTHDGLLPLCIRPLQHLLHEPFSASSFICHGIGPCKVHPLSQVGGKNHTTIAGRERICRSRSRWHEDHPQCRERKGFLSIAHFAFFLISEVRTALHFRKGSFHGPA